MGSGKSPYLKDRRLEDLIAAIQVMGVTPWAGSENWPKKLDEPLSGDSWKDIFSQHPEFFRINKDWVTLRWRFTYDKTYDVKKHRVLSDTELDSLSNDEKEGLTYKPLEAAQIETLINTAIELHSHAISQQEEKRWLKSILIPSGFTLLGVILGVLATLGNDFLTNFVP